MTRRARRAIFYGLLALFFLLGAAVVLYAEGWRFDFATWRAQKVGAIFVRSFPGDAAIFLDGAPVPNQSNFLFHGTLISGLFPKNYAVTLKEKGYVDWRENATVAPSLVTEFKYAVLVPRTPVTVATSAVTNFYAASGEIVFQTPADAIVWRGKTVARGNLVSASDNFKTIVVRNAATGAYALYDFGQGTTTALGMNAAAAPQIMIDPYDPEKIVAGNDKKIFVFDATAGALSTVARAAQGEIFSPSFAASPSLIAWTKFKSASGTATVVLYDKFAETTEEGSSTIPGSTRALKWISGNVLGILQNDGSLYSYDTEAAKFQKIADDVKEFEAASDGTALAALENKSLEVIPLTDAQTYHRLNLTGIARALRVIWYTDMNHLFVVYPDSVSFLDLDDAGLRNFVTVAQGTNPLYKPQENILYLINSAQKLVQFDFPK